MFLRSGKLMLFEKKRRKLFPVTEQKWRGWGGGGGRLGRPLYRGKCISTTPIGAPIYIWPRAAIPPGYIFIGMQMVGQYTHM